MKRFAARTVALLLTVILCVGALPLGAMASTESDFSYDIYNGEATIFKYTGTDRHLVIPETLGGYPVTAFGYRAFSGNADLESVTIHGGVKSFHRGAFDYCPNLQTVVMEEGISHVAQEMFRGCGELKTVILPDSVVTIEFNAFEGCTALTEIQLPANLRDIHKEAFAFTGLTDVVLPQGVEAVGEGAFMGCALQSITMEGSGSYYCRMIDNCLLYGGLVVAGFSGAEIPAEENVYAIGKGAFCNVPGLTSVSIPDNIAKIGESAFQGCPDLRTVDMGNGVREMESRVFMECPSLENVRISPALSKLGGLTFYACTAMREIYVPSSLTVQGSDFQLCFGLEQIKVESGHPLYSDAGNCLVRKADGMLMIGCQNSVIPHDGSVTSIEYNAFYGVVGLTHIEIPDSVVSIGGYAFGDCTELRSVRFGRGLETIDSGAFKNCSALQDIQLPDGLTKIGKAAFENCHGLTTVRIPASVTQMEERAFYGCSQLTDIYCEASSEPSGWESYWVPDRVNVHWGPCWHLETVIDDEGAPTCISAGYLREVCTQCGGVLREEYREAYGHAFGADGICSHCGVSEKLQYYMYDRGEITITGFDGTGELVIPHEICGFPVTVIGYEAFRGNTGLTSVTIPSSVKRIGNYAFAGTGLQRIDLPDSLQELGAYLFLDCTGLQKAKLPGNLERIPEGLFYGCTSLELPDFPESLTHLGDCSFYRNQRVQELVLPAGLVYFGGMSFAECPNLTSVRFLEPENADHPGMTMGSTAFYQCPALKSVALSPVLTSIGSGAFSGCTSLTEMILPRSVTEIGSNIFAGCKSLRKVELRGGLTAIPTWAFRDCSSLTEIVIPATVKTIGDSAFENCTSLHTAAIPDGVTTIGNSAFRSCTALREIILPDSVTVLGAFSFHNCSSATVLRLSNSLEVLENDTFYHCLFKEVIIPDSVTTIKGSAFCDLSLLEVMYIPAGVTSVGDMIVRNTHSGGVIICQAEACPPGWSAGWKDTCSCTVIWGGCIHPNKEFTEKIDATCKEDSYTIYHCPDCLQAVTEVHKGSALGHSYESGVCIRCGAVKGDPESHFRYEIHDGEAYLYEYLGSNKVVTVPSELGGYPVRVVMNISFYQRDDVKKVILPPGLREIRDDAFINCTGLEEIVIPDSVTLLGKHAFSGCSSLRSVRIPVGITCLETNLFSECTSLTDVVLPEGLEVISHGVFHRCTSLETIEIPGSVTMIDGAAFMDCSSLKEIHLPEGLQVLGDAVFWECNKLTKLVIPSTVMALGDESPDGMYCRNLMVLEVAPGNPFYHSQGNCIIETSTKLLLYGCSGSVIPTDGSVLKIADHAFAGSSFTTFTVPSPVIHVGMEAFIECDRLKELILADSVKTLGMGALDMMPALESVRLSAGLTDLPEGLFYECASLKSLVIPEGVKTIGFNLLFGCDSLEEIHLPSTVKSIADGAFGYAGALRTITVAENNPYFTGRGNCLIRIKDKCLVTGTAYSVIPDDGSVTKIGSGAFMGNKLIRGMIIPPVIREIGREAFACTPNLKVLYIPNSVTTVGERILWESGAKNVYCQAASRPDGWSSGSNSWISDSNAVARWGKAMCKHTEVTDDGFKSTCTEAGFLHRWCNVCYGTLVYSPQPLADHIYGENGFCNICGHESSHKPEDNPQPDVECLYGDINGDEKINTVDYVLLKRYVMKTYKLTEEQLEKADVNQDGRINTADYVLVKRHVMGRYQLPTG